MEKDINELEPPDGVDDPHSYELMRAWVVDQKLVVSLRSGVLDSPEAWGYFLAELAVYVQIVMLQENPAFSLAEVRKKIREGFMERLDSIEGDPDE